MTTRISKLEIQRKEASGYRGPSERRDKCCRCVHADARLVYPYLRCKLHKIEIKQQGICPSFKDIRDPK